MGEFLDIKMDTAAAVGFLGELAQRLQAGTLLEATIKPTIEDAIETSFATESSPEGESWAELAPSTIKQLKREGRSLKKLQRTGEGKRSIKVIVSGNRLYVQYLDYMEFHQQGTENMEQRQFVPTQRDIESGKIGRQIQREIESFLNPTFGQFVRGEVGRTPFLRRLVRRRSA